MGINFKLLVKIDKKCWYSCDGAIEKVISPIDPYVTPISFDHIKDNPLAKSQITCEKNAFQQDL